MIARIFSTSACIAALAAAAPALGQGQGCYTLTGLSTYRQGCTACECPPETEYPLEGTFRLQLASLSQFGEFYEVTDVSLQIKALPPADPPHTTITGSGTYTRSRPLFSERTHTLSLDLSIDGGPIMTYVNSMPVPEPFEFPVIAMKIGDIEFPCLNVLNIAAEPSCFCEMTCDAVIDVFDLLGYLDLWFPADFAADIDNSGGVDVFDLLMYLDCWFAQCR